MQQSIRIKLQTQQFAFKQEENQVQISKQPGQPLKHDFDAISRVLTFGKQCAVVYALENGKSQVAIAMRFSLVFKHTRGCVCHAYEFTACDACIARVFCMKMQSPHRLRSRLDIDEMKSILFPQRAATAVIASEAFLRSKSAVFRHSGYVLCFFACLRASRICQRFRLLCVAKLFLLTAAMRTTWPESAWIDSCVRELTVTAKFLLVLQ